MGIDLYIIAERRTEAGWREQPADFLGTESRDLWAVLLGWNDPPELMKPVAAFLPLRGWPDDVSPHLARLRGLEADPNSGISHAHWLTAREVLEFPWRDRRVTHSFHPDKSRPLGYLVPGAADGTYTESYANFVGRAWTDFDLPMIRALGPPDDVRLVLYLA